MKLFLNGFKAMHTQTSDFLGQRVTDNAPCETADSAIGQVDGPPANLPERKYLDIESAGSYLSCSKRTIYKLCALRKLAYHEAAGLRWFLKEDLDEYIASGRVDVYGGRRHSRKTA